MGDKEIVENINKVLAEVQAHKREIIQNGRSLSKDELKCLEHLAKADRLLQNSKHEMFGVHMHSKRIETNKTSKQAA